MKRLVWLLGALVLLCDLLGPAALPAAAQAGGACPMISDDALSQAFGTTVHSQDLIYSQSDTSGPSVADECLAALGGQSILLITHMVGVQPADTSSALSMSQRGPGAMFAAIDPSLLTTTPISGLGDSAISLSANLQGQPYANLIVWQGSDSYSIIGTGLSDPTVLQGVAQTILSGQH